MNLENYRTPWHEEPHVFNLCPISLIRDANGNGVGVVATEVGRLVSAAPDLLAAVIRLTEIVFYVYLSEGHYCGPDDIDMGRAAIAKAMTDVSGLDEWFEERVDV